MIQQISVFVGVMIFLVGSFFLIFVIGMLVRYTWEKGSSFIEIIEEILLAIDIEPGLSRKVTILLGVIVTGLIILRLTNTNLVTWFGEFFPLLIIILVAAAFLGYLAQKTIEEDDKKKSC